MQSLKKKIGIVYHGKHEAALACSQELEECARQAGFTVWMVPASAEQEIRKQACDSGLVLAVGGDGTLLRAAKGMAGCETPIVGINLGKLGFMTEISPQEAMAKLPQLVAGAGWVDTRAMLQAKISSQDRRFTALNDIVVSRGGTCRMIRIEARIDGEVMTTYRADGLIVATATGSTSYSLASGGPIVYPQSTDILLQPISPHLTLSRCLVLPPTSTIELIVTTDRPATLSVDGQEDVDISNGEKVTIRLSDRVVKFLRLHPPSYFFQSLIEKLKGEPVC